MRKPRPCFPVILTERSWASVVWNSDRSDRPSAAARDRPRSALGGAKSVLTTE